MVSRPLSKPRACSGCFEQQKLKDAWNALLWVQSREKCTTRIPSLPSPCSLSVAVRTHICCSVKPMQANVSLVNASPNIRINDFISPFAQTRRLDASGLGKEKTFKGVLPKPALPRRCLRIGGILWKLEGSLAKSRRPQARAKFLWVREDRRVKP